MTIRLDHLPSNSSHLCLRSYRDAAKVLLQNESQLSQRPSPLEPCTKKEPLSSPCGSPPRFSLTSSPPRCRSQTRSASQSPPKSRETSSKVARTVSPGPSSSQSPQSALRRRVHWANDLVASVCTRPRTQRSDIPLLFYSKADERRFRREAETADYEESWCTDAEECAPTEPAPSSSASSGREVQEHKPLWSPERERKDYAISKAVVVFGQSTRTYGAGCALEAALESHHALSFDDSAFWNGVLTWS